MAKPDLQDYQVREKANEEAFFEILKQLSPELYVLNKMILDEKLSLAVFYKIARQLINIGAGTGYGDIHILIEDKIVRFINGTEKDKVNESIVKAVA
jgi:hypothetical protein